MPAYVIADPLLFLLGLIFCVGGFVVYWFSLKLAGAYMGAMAGAGLGLLVGWVLDAQSHQALFAAGGGLLGLIVGIWIVRKLANVAFFALGGMAGLGVGRVLAVNLIEGASSTPLFEQSLIFWAIVLGVSIGCGILAMWGRNALMIVLTSLAGALCLNAAIDPFPSAWVAPAPAILASIWQFWMVRRLRKLMKNRKK